MVVMHNDAVVQGSSELPYMQDYKRLGVLTIGRHRPRQCPIYAAAQSQPLK